MFFRSPSRVLFLGGLILLVAITDARAVRRAEPVFAESAQDLALRHALSALGPMVSPEEARQVAFTAYTTGSELAREWRVVWPPGFQNFLVHTGARKGGLCFQWAEELLIRLDRLNLKTLDLHWAESYAGDFGEHNVIVVTAKGQPFALGVLLDNWRYSGRLVWGVAAADPHYQWQENKIAAAARLERAHAAARVLKALPVRPTKRARAPR